MTDGTILVTGSRGSIGRKICPLLKQKYNLFEVDIELGYDLTNYSAYAEFFGERSVKYILNLFAVNEHVSVQGSSGMASLLSDFEGRSGQQYYDVNCVALFNLCSYLISNQSIKSIINISSIYGGSLPDPSLHSGRLKNIWYGASKASVEYITQYMAKFAAPDTRINCIRLGGVEFEQSSDFIEKYSKKVPMQRMANVSDLYHLADFLFDEQRSSYITGSVIPLDGGWAL